MTTTSITALAAIHCRCDVWHPCPACTEARREASERRMTAARATQEAADAEPTEDAVA